MWAFEVDQVHFEVTFVQIEVAFNHVLKDGKPTASFLRFINGGFVFRSIKQVHGLHYEGMTFFAKLLDLITAQLSEQLTWSPQNEKGLIATENQLANYVFRPEKWLVNWDGATLKDLVTMERVSWFNLDLEVILLRLLWLSLILLLLSLRM